MKLEPPRPRYDRYAASMLQRQIEQADAENHKRNRDIEVGVASLILTAPNGTRWRVQVDNSGALSTVVVT